MKSRKIKKQDERACVNELIKAVRKNSTSLLYVHVDRDCGALRHTSSGWDFLLSRDGKTVFNEAKIENKLLTDWQRFTKVEVETAGGRYNVVRFWDNGETFTVNGVGVYRTDEAKLKDFL